MIIPAIIPMLIPNPSAIPIHLAMTTPKNCPAIPATPTITLCIKPLSLFFILDKEYGKVSSSIKIDTSNLDLPKYYTSEEGYSFKVNKVKKTGGKKEGKYIIHLTQPDNERKKCLYSEPNINNAIETVVNYINLPFINVKCFKC